MAAIAAMALRPSTPSQLSPPHHGLAVQRGPAAKSRTRGAMLRFAAVFCGIVSARSFTATKAVGTDRASRTASTATEAGDGRKVQIKAEKVKEVKLQDAEMKIMDDLMRKEAVNILAAGAERTEEVKGAKGLWYAYMEPTRMGTWKNQARLKCKLELAKSGAVNVEVVEIEVGSWDRDLQKFIYEKFAEESFSLNWMNSLTWKEKGNDLYLLHTSRGDMELLLPWWFPLPDAVVKATFQAGIRYMISDGQAKISEAVTKRYQQAAGRPST